MKEDRPIHHRRCRCTKGRWAWDGGERKQRHRVELWWRGALAREEVKYRRGWVMGENVQGWDEIFITVEDVSRTMQGGWPAAVVRIQYFDFDSRGETMGRSVADRWSGGSELVLTSWKDSVTRRDDVMTSTKGEATPGSEKGGNNVSWADTNFIGPKNKENSHGRFSCYKWMMQI
jgi:hypothetical protein